MKRAAMTLIFLLVLTPLVLALTEQPMVPVDEFNNPIDLASQPKPTTDMWNETIIISDTWQTLINTFFGLNLKEKTPQTSVKQAITLFSIFIMFIIIILDVLKMTPFFKMKLGPVSGEFIAALAVTSLVSISGAFINLKDLIVQGAIYTTTTLDWQWVRYLTEHRTIGIIITILVIFPLLFIVHEALDILNSNIKKYSKISKAEEKGRRFNALLEDKD